MNVINTIRTIVLASSLVVGFSSNASAADAAPEKYVGSDGKTAWTLKLGTAEMGYIQDVFSRSSRTSQANKWALLVDGEVVTIDGQLVVLWTRDDGGDFLMVTNFGDQAITEQVKLEYLDGVGKEYVDIAAQPGTTAAIEVYRSDYSMRTFALYDENDDFLAQLAWKVAWVMYVDN